MREPLKLASEAELTAFGESLVGSLAIGNLVLLTGPLGAGKTTLVRSVLRALGWQEPVRSPTFNLIATYSTMPPVMHADLYRLESAAGLGLEEFADSHLCFIEWPDRLDGLFDGREGIIRIDLQFDGEGRLLTLDR